MNDKYRVALTLFHTGDGAIQRSYMYTCKHIVGGLSDLIFKLSFDEDYFSYSYRHSGTTLQFVKDDMREILNCSTGYNHYDSLGNKYQDKSYNASNKIKIQLIDNYTNIVFLESYLDINQQRIIPPYLEVPLIENVDIKEKIEQELSYSLQEISNSVLDIDTSNYAGNPIIEKASLFGVGMIDDSWGGANNMTPNTNYQVNGITWFKPTQYLAVEGQSDSGIYASGEMWGRYGGRSDIEVLSDISVTKAAVGGFTIKDMNKSVILDLKISFYLKRKRLVKIMGIVSNYRQTKLNLYLTTYDEYSMSRTTVLVKQISVSLEGEYEIYEIKDLSYRKILNFSSLAPQLYNIRGYFTIRFPQDLEKPSQVNLSLGDENYRYNFYIVENTVTEKGYSFRCDAEINATCNSKKDAKNKLSGIRLLDYLSFIANKAGINVSYPTLTAYGLNNILYSSENLLNFHERQTSDDKYLEIIENCSLKDVIDWLNNQFCLSIYVDENNDIIISTRDSYTAPTREATIEVNRLIEIKPQKVIKTIKAGSVKYEISTFSNAESMNTDCTWKLDTEIDGQELDITCNICTDPQFVDWMLIKKDLTGDKKILIETKTIDNIVGLHVAEITKVTPNRTDGVLLNSLPNFDTWEERNFVNVFLSPLSQIQRWRKYITTPPQGFRYKLIKCDTNFINAIKQIRVTFPYMRIYSDNGLPIIFNNSNTIIMGLPRYTEKAGIKIRDFDTSGYILPLRMKVQTPIYTQFINARRKALVRFTYNGKTLIGYPNEVSTYFGEQVQEIEVELINTSTITNINDLIE